MSNQTCQIVITKFRADQLDIKFSTNLNQATAKSIYNAWKQTAILDNYGSVWLGTDKLAQILRTSKANANYIKDNIRDEYKRHSAEGTYLNYIEVNRILGNIIQSAGSLKREQYAEFSESIGLAIRNCDKAKLLRAEMYESIRSEKRKLKSTRIRLLSIAHDELTQKPLLPSCQFSHIRSCAIYPNLATSYWNGLILNQNIHQIITKNEINDEHQLLELCKERGWNTRWHQPYLADICNQGEAA
jgi:hypothetical protein